MLPHPILASEDDEEYVIRSVLGLPDLVAEYFSCLEAIYVDCKTEEYSTRVSALYLAIQRHLLILNRVPRGSYRIVDEETGRDNVDKELPMMLLRLSNLFLEDVVGVGPQALSWKKPCQRLSNECAERMRSARIEFPIRMKWRRKLVTFKSLPFFLLIVIYGLVVLFSTVCIIVLAVVHPPTVVSINLGLVAVLLLLLTSALMVNLYAIATKSLQMLYIRLHHELMSPRVTDDAFTGNFWDTTGGVYARRSLHAGSTSCGAPKIARGRHTRKGYYSIPYGDDIGYIDGRQLDAQVVMIAYDKNFLITRWNNAAEVMTGFLEDGCVGKPISELVLSPTGSDICDNLRQSRKGQLIKIKLRALAMAPAILYTSVVPIANTDGAQIGSVLICANAKDNLREFRTYIHNYQTSETRECISRILDRGTLSHEDAGMVASLLEFVGNCYPNHVEELAREMLADWEWTNTEQLLGQGLGNSINLHDVHVDTLFPQTLCVNPLLAKTFGMVVSLADSQCSLYLEILNPTNNVFTLSVSISQDGKGRPWNLEKLEWALQSMLRRTGGNVYFSDERVVLHFPCQVAAILNDSEDEVVSDQALQLTQARAIINCTVNVVTLISNIVDQHNVSLILLKTMFVSLASVRERNDLEQRLSARPCDVDAVICDSEWLSSSRDILLSGDHGAIIIPMVNSNIPVLQEFQYVIRTPIVGRELQKLMVDVGKVVSLKQNAAMALRERERILTLHQDSPWTKGKLLGRGSFGAVYEATSDLTGGKMAVKMFYFAADREESINQLLNEIKIMCSLNHPNIVHYFHCERKDNEVSLFMELCQASLTDIMRGSHKKPPHLTVVQILRQVITAVAYLHGRGITHRDIKPQNILLKAETIKLTDFGTARQGDVSKEVSGTFRYMAPEVYKKEPHSLPCDIWSIGCLACELFACPPKFMNDVSLLGEMASAMPYLDEVPQNVLLRDFLYRCFKLNPEQRSTSQDLLTHQLLSSNAMSAEVDRLPTVFDAQRLAKQKVDMQSTFSISSSAGVTVRET